MPIFPDVVGLKKVTGSYTESGLGAGATVTRTITLKNIYLLIGVPNVSTETTDATVKLVNGGKYSFDVEITNNGGAAADVVVDYTAYVLEGA